MFQVFDAALVPALGLALFALWVAVLAWLTPRDRRRCCASAQRREREAQIRGARLADEERAWPHMTEGEREQTRVAGALLCRGEEA